MVDFFHSFSKVVIWYRPELSIICSKLTITASAWHDDRGAILRREFALFFRNSCTHSAVLVLFCSYATLSIMSDSARLQEHSSLL
jgi:hypothetical protein